MPKRQYLIIIVRSISEKKDEKNYIIKICNCATDLHIQIDNKFYHGFQYEYKLWPCKQGLVQKVRIQLIQKLKHKQQVIKNMRGEAEVQICYSHEGQLYKFYGNREENSTIFVYFKVENLDETEVESCNKEFIEMNQKMETSLKRYKAQIQNYQSFLQNTNFLLKQLNVETPRQLKTQDNHKQLPQQVMIPEQISEQQSEKDINLPKNHDQEQRLGPTPTKQKKNTKNINQKNEKPQQIKQIQSKLYQQDQQEHAKDTPEKNNPQQQMRSTFLSKYRYLEAIKLPEKQVSIKNTSNGGLLSATHSIQKYINIKRGKIQKELEKQTVKSDNENMSNKDISKEKKFSIQEIKKRRQMYFIKNKNKYLKPQADSQARQYSPISKLQFLKNKEFQTTKNVEKEEIKKPIRLLDQIMQTSNVENLQQTHKKVSQFRNNMRMGKEDEGNEDQDQTYIQPIFTNEVYTKGSANRQDFLNKDIIVRRADFPTGNTSRVETYPSRSIYKDSSALLNYNFKKIRQNDTNSKSLSKENASQKKELTFEPSLKQTIKRQEVSNENRLNCISFYNFKARIYSTIKSDKTTCILRYKNKDYATGLEDSNFKSIISWNDRITIDKVASNSIIQLKVASLLNKSMKEQGRTQINIEKLLSQQNSKFYIFSNQLAIGFVTFDIEIKTMKEIQRNSISLPEIKKKQRVSCEKKIEKTSNTDRIQTQAKQSTSQFKNSINQLRTKLMNVSHITQSAEFQRSDYRHQARNKNKLNRLKMSKKIKDN